MKSPLPYWRRFPRFKEEIITDRDRLQQLDLSVLDG